MNYTRIYTSIVLRAQAERTERLALKKQGKYFENHHIVPRSLGGKDVQSNMALQKSGGKDAVPLGRHMRAGRNKN